MINANEIISPMLHDSTYNYYEKYADEYFQATYSTDLAYQWNKFTNPLAKNTVILDIGSGSGRDLRYFASKGYKAFGLDYSYNLAKLAHDYSKQEVIVGDLRDIPIRKHVFGAVWSIGSMLHLRPNELKSALSQIYCIMNQKGVFFTAVKKGEGDVLDMMGRYTVFYQMDQWTSLLEQSGFEIMSIEEVVEHRKTSQGQTIDVNWLECIAIKL